MTSTSGDGSTSTKAFTISITDHDEFDVTTPTDSDDTANTVAEDIANGQTVGITASATDADGTTNTVTYTVHSQSCAGALQISDDTSGVVTVADTNALDREAGETCTVTVRATSTDGSTADQTFTLTLTDVDESDVTNPTDSDATANTVAESIANGATVGITASASDADATTNTVTYDITDQSCAGALSVHTLDRSRHRRRLRPSTARTARLHRDDPRNQHRHLHGLHDLHAHPDRRRRGRHRRDQRLDGTANTVVENAADNTAVGITASATDADATDDTTYSMVIDTAGCDGYFDIGSSDGIVRVDGTNEMNYESVQSCTVTVTSTSDDGSTSTAQFTISLTDHDEFDVTTPTDSDNTANTVAEDIADGQTVGITASASDADGTTNTVTYAITAQSCTGALQIIDSSTGVAVGDTTALDYDTATSCTVTTKRPPQMALMQAKPSHSP